MLIFYLCVPPLSVLPACLQIGFSNNAELFFRFFLMSFLMCLCYASLSQLWLALCPNQIVLNVLNGLFMSLFFMSVEGRDARTRNETTQSR